MTRPSLTHTRVSLFALALLGLLWGSRTAAAAPLAQARKWWGDYLTNPTTNAPA